MILQIITLHTHIARSILLFIITPGLSQASELLQIISRRNMLSITIILHLSLTFLLCLYPSGDTCRSVASIGYYALKESSLTSIVVPTSVTFIDKVTTNKQITSFLL